MSGDPFEFMADNECPVCADTFESAEDAYDHIRLHDIDLDGIESGGTGQDGDS